MGTFFHVKYLKTVIICGCGSKACVTECDILSRNKFKRGNQRFNFKTD